MHPDMAPHPIFSPRQGVLWTLQGEPRSFFLTALAERSLSLSVSLFFHLFYKKILHAGVSESLSLSCLFFYTFTEVVFLSIHSLCLTALPPSLSLFFLSCSGLMSCQNNRV